MARFIKTGTIQHLNHARPHFGFAPSSDFRESLEIISRAEEAFSELPSDIRADFDNDPGQFLAFVENKDNIPQMADYGLLTPEAVASLGSPAESASTGELSPSPSISEQEANPPSEPPSE